MEELFAPYAAALTLGAAHALEVDHMAAVTTFVGGRPHTRAALLFGLRWGVGHAAAVLLAGTLLAASGLSLPETLEHWAEAGVGLMLIALGIWAAWNARRLHVHDPASHASSGQGHAHLHAHNPTGHPHGHEHVDPDRRHRHLSTLVGAVHGLAGTAPLLVLVPVTMIEDIRAAVGYLAAFGIGTIAAMAGYAVLTALAVRSAARSLRRARIAAAATASASALVGLVWLVRAAGALTAG